MGDAAKAAGHGSNIGPEERHLKDLRFGNEGYGMRGDGIVRTLEDFLSVDVVIAHPASKTFRGRAGRTPGAAADVLEANKCYPHSAGGNRCRFAPFAVETYGRLAILLVAVLCAWTDAAGDTGPFLRDAYLTWVKRELSVSVVRINVRLFKPLQACCVAVSCSALWRFGCAGASVCSVYA
jgi:hypothetical protein